MATCNGREAGNVVSVSKEEEVDFYE